MSADPYIAIWEFTVPPEQTAAFVAAYGPAGLWAELFRRAPGFRGTELYRDRESPQLFVTLDFWLNEDAFRHFRSAFSAEYEALDRRCESLTASERRLGTFGLADQSQRSL
jgi:heme-degrading monooxygenase HmoA